MKKLTLSITFALVIFLGSAMTKQASADICGGKPGLQVYSQTNYTGSTATFCASWVYPGWWNIWVSYVGDTWNDKIKSYRLQNWPLNKYTMTFYHDGGFGGTPLSTFINHDPETNSNTCNYGYTYCDISSFKITSHP